VETVSDTASGELLAEAVAVFSYVPQLANTVALVMCTLAEASAAKSPMTQLSVWTAGAVPVMVHVPGPEYAGEIDQETPSPMGNGSLIVTPCAPPGPKFVTVTVKPIALPALTVPASAVFVVVSDGHCTTSEALAWTDGLLVEVSEAVFG
jgi:hypothetical protein